MFGFGTMYHFLEHLSWLLLTRQGQGHISKFKIVIAPIGFSVKEKQEKKEKVSHFFSPIYGALWFLFRLPGSCCKLCLKTIHLFCDCHLGYFGPFLHVLSLTNFKVNSACTHQKYFHLTLNVLLLLLTCYYSIIKCIIILLCKITCSTKLLCVHSK